MSWERRCWKIGRNYSSKKARKVHGRSTAHLGHSAKHLLTNLNPCSRKMGQLSHCIEFLVPSREPTSRRDRLMDLFYPSLSPSVRKCWLARACKLHQQSAR